MNKIPAISELNPIALSVIEDLNIEPYLFQDAKKCGDYRQMLANTLMVRSAPVVASWLQAHKASFEPYLIPVDELTDMDQLNYPKDIPDELLIKLGQDLGDLFSSHLAKLSRPIWTSSFLCAILTGAFPVPNTTEEPGISVMQFNPFRWLQVGGSLDRLVEETEKSDLLALRRRESVVIAIDRKTTVNELRRFIEDASNGLADALTHLPMASTTTEKIDVNLLALGIWLEERGSDHTSNEETVRKIFKDFEHKHPSVGKRGYGVAPRRAEFSNARYYARRKVSALIG